MLMRFLPKSNTLSHAWLVLPLLLTQDLMAAESWLYCAPPVPPVPGLSPLQVLNRDLGGATSMDADQVRQDGNLYFFRGDVRSLRNGQELLADEVDYDGDEETVQARGNVRFHSDGQIVSGDKGDFQLDKNTGVIKPARYWLTERHMRGDATQINIESKTLSTLEAARFTTCDEGSNAWWFQTSSLELDTEAGQGTAYNARLKIKHVPVFYLPYLSFPIDDRRKSGFLMPSVGHDKTSGNEFTIPYYWNIAPQRDATITPRYMHWRGLLLNSEFRYLNEHSRGELDVGLMSNDKIYGDDRSIMDFSHSGEPAKHWKTSLQYRYASDTEYQNDFSSEFSASSLTHLERRADIAYNVDDWQASLAVQAYQTVDDSIAEISRPYRRMPQLLFNLNERDAVAGMTYGMEMEWVRFDKDAGLVGNRADFQPYISWPLSGNAGFLVPKLKYQLTTYNLQQGLNGADNTPTRTLPIFSVDSGLFFERDIKGKGRAKLQTMEPRLYYLQVPYRHQADLIVDENGASQVFDTGLSGFSLDQMFRENRFTGVDRVGDAKQLSLALTSRFLDDDGRELLNISLGRSYYFRNRDVTLPGGVQETRGSSDWLATMNSDWTPGLTSSASILWDTQKDEISQGNLDLRYQESQNKMLRMGYRYSRDSQIQLDTAGIWPLAPQWNLIGRRLHSLYHNATLETVAGVEYESCCWNLRFLSWRRRNSVTDHRMESTIWLQLELKGLTSVGREVKGLISHDILQQ